MASDVQRWFDSEARQTEAIARAERDALAAEVSALRAALEAAETDAQLCRERLGDERERRRAAEARAVPEAPTVDDLEAYIVTAMIQWDADTAGTRALPGYIARSIHPRLVPLSPTDTPEDPT